MWTHPWWAGLAMAAAAGLVALAVDALWGEPPAWAHPVVWMGRALGALGTRIAPGDLRRRDYPAFWAAALVWCVLAALVLIVAGSLQWLLLHHLPPWLAALALGGLLKPLLAWRMLHAEVQAVEEALAESLQAGRERLAWLVSRDTAALSAAEVRESAIESLAENLSDSVVAPLVWFALLGLPGAALYRFANTADAMWGYPGWRGQGAARRHWQWAGKWAARADDALSWLPARLTAALLLVTAARRVPAAGLRRDARATPSPNGGWPMGAMARLLDVRLGKPGAYVLNPQGQPPQSAHMALALVHARNVVRALACIALAAMIFAFLTWMRL
ncbi:adenosylcobinamide-phosphate synthase CbiB [Pulveribacter suum]|uniref:Cobalamin biosynthesis protein CobD n=1 Tax=Pulveribacter suum TaxID=2116657 RepID=A0A2P1NL66_9BURK|nr:adenosylcobinamide-phosphate synthase CbiB [Pulveribacter suum]AVP57794.1 cobalamin biosynthesis protein CobD [Pulveribacter suum]